MPHSFLGERMVTIYTDGAINRSSQITGAGVVVVYGQDLWSKYTFAGYGTSNHAELKAIELGLRTVRKLPLEFSHDILVTPVTLYTDSKYCVGMLTRDWKARENIALIEEIKLNMELFADLTIKWIKGHAGHPYNEMADRLASLAVAEEVARLAAQRGIE